MSRYLLYAIALAVVIGLAVAGLWERFSRVMIPLSTYTDNSIANRAFRSSDGAIRLTRLFPTDVTTVPVFSWGPSPQPVELGGKPFIVAVAMDGKIASIDPTTSKILWATRLPIPWRCLPRIATEIYLHRAFGPRCGINVYADPVRVGDKLVIVYSIVSAETPLLYRAAVLDLNEGKLDWNFPPIDFAAEKKGIKFIPSWQGSHAGLAHVGERVDQLGLVYVGFGGGLAERDRRPWRGWLFELDLDAWRSKSSTAIRSELITSPEADCSGEDGSQKICGGGIWSPAGPQIYINQEGYEVLVQTGNGRLDLNRGSYAQSLMRLRKGLVFAPGCDRVICGLTNPRDPSKECLETCDNLFVPRLLPGDPPLNPEDHGGYYGCRQKSFLECLEAYDWDFGANAPIKIQLPSGRAVYVTAGKEGGVYLLDAKRMGVLYDRKQAVDLCGTVSDPCQVAYEGSMITQPVLGWVDGTPVVVIPTFMLDETHPAGLVAFKVIEKDGVPKLEQFWSAPERGSQDAVKMFRTPPTRAVIGDYQGEAIVWVADAAPEGPVVGVKLRDGSILARAKTAGTPMLHSKPFVLNDVLYIQTEMRGSAGAWLEAYSISSEVNPPNQKTNVRTNK
jgi:hypothetical protein